MTTSSLRRLFLGLCILSLAGLASFAEEPEQGPGLGLLLGASASYDLEGGLSSEELISIDLDASYFDLIGTLSANSDGKYAPALANLPGGDFMKIYFMMEEGGIRSELGPLSLKAGRLRHYDVLDSPYSLFVNSGGHAALHMDIRYEDDFFFYESRWLELNQGSADADSLATDAAWKQGYPNRGANLKTFGFKLGEMRFGFQDAAVYTGRSFDLEYFLSPIPQYFIQYVKSTPGRPWNTDSNENNIIGAFWDWKRDDGLSFLAQVLVDDFNVHAIAPSTTWNPWKFAFSLGGRAETSAGRFGLYSAGATKYSFEPIDLRNTDTEAEARELAYGYTYYPDTRFDIDKDSSVLWSPIGIEDNAIGYQYGENNLVFGADWLHELSGFELAASAELRLAGANSPANPWHDNGHFPTGGTKWIFSEPLLEKRVLVGFEAGRRFGSWRLFAALKAGVAIDALELRAPLPGSEDVNDPPALNIEKHLWLWAPTAGLNQPIFKLSLGGSYAWRLR